MNNSLSIVSSLIIFLFPYIGRKWFSRELLSSTVVSLGLLGTFGGIMYGLWVFGIEKIDESIPQLLEGLKTAFLTSIAGMTSSLILKLCPLFYGIRVVADQKEENSENQLLALLKDIRDNTRISSNTELLNEIRQMRENTQQALENLNQNLASLTQKGVQIDTESLEGVLQEIITQLDTKIAEQIHDLVENINTTLSKQLELIDSGQETNSRLNEYLQDALAKIQSTNDNIELFLNKSTNLNFRQNESFNAELSRFGNYMKTSEEHFQNQLNQMDEKYTRELTEMEKFTRTLTLIIQKLAQDHNTLYKKNDSEN